MTLTTIHQKLMAANLAVVGVQKNNGVITAEAENPEEQAAVNAALANIIAEAEMEAQEKANDLSQVQVQANANAALAQIALDIAALQNASPPTAAEQRAIVVRMLQTQRKIIKYLVAQL